MKEQSSVRSQQDPGLPLSCSPGRLHWNCSTLCLWEGQQPLNLILQLSLLNFLLAPLPSCIAFVCPWSDVTHFHPGQAHRMQLPRLRWNMRKSVFPVSVGQELNRVWSMQLSLVPLGSARPFSNGQPGISRAPPSQLSSELATGMGCNQALERCDTCRCPSIIPCLKWLKLLDSFSHFFGKAPILLIEGLCSSSLHFSQSTSSICSRVTPQWLHSQLC